MTDDTDQQTYHALCCYTLAHGSPSFIHQHVVDAFAAQHADERTKPIALAFALIGLYLHVEKGFSGKDVQRAHMQLARAKHQWPAFALSTNRGAMTVADVMRQPEGPPRDRAIHDWAVSVWNAFIDHRDALANLLHEHGVVRGDR